jgi:hypothetical protein
MKTQNAPGFATWLLKLFCSGPENESLIGDLMERHQQHGGRLRFWRETLDILLHSTYCKLTRRQLTATPRIPVGQIFATVLILLALVMVLLSDISTILLIPVLVGSWVACLHYLRRDKSESIWRSGPVVPSPSPKIARIDSSKISVGGGAGAGILILILLVSVLHDLPMLRALALPGLLGGLVFAVALRLWGRWHPRNPEKDWVTIGPGSKKQ